MEQKVVMLMTASGAAIGAIANLQKQIDETLAEHKGWRVMSANTTMAIDRGTMHYTTTLVLERQIPRLPRVLSVHDGG